MWRAKRQNKQLGIRRLHLFKSLARGFAECVRSAFFALLSRPSTDGLATAGHTGRSHVDQIAEWLVDIEQEHLPFKRFVDFSRLTAVAVRTDHVFEFARKRAEQFTGVEAVRTVLFANDWVGRAIARLYESLMENTLIEARAFFDRAKAAEWLAIPVAVLTLKDRPAPRTGSHGPETF